VLVPVERRAAVAADLEVAHRLALEHGPGLVDDAQLVARHRPPGAAAHDLAGDVRAEDVQHLGRADPVDDLEAEALAPAVEHDR
jgi:hypothetical protein